MKHGNVTLDQIEAAVSKLGGQEMWDAWLRGEKTVIVKDVVQSLFDKHNRWNPNKNLQYHVCDEDMNFRIDHPRLATKYDWYNHVQLLHESLGVNTGITGRQFKNEYQRLRKMISDTPQIADILKRVCLPVILTKRHNDDIGKDLEWQLKGVRKSYVKTFKGREFIGFLNNEKRTLADEVWIVKESGYQSIWDRKASEHIIALFFPNPLQGYSVLAQREQMAILSKFGFILSGAVEPMVMWPSVLAQDYAPNLNLAAFCWHGGYCSLLFKSFDNRLWFGSKDGLGESDGDTSGSLLYCG